MDLSLQPSHAYVSAGACRGHLVAFLRAPTPPGRTFRGSVEPLPHCGVGERLDWLARPRPVSGLFDRAEDASAPICVAVVPQRPAPQWLLESLDASTQSRSDRAR